MIKMGILQGRLSRPVDGKIQEFPFETWQEEFYNLNKVGLTHIEWIITKDSFAENPFFKRKLNGYYISSICADNLVDKRIGEREFLEEQLTPICDAALRNNVNCITIPLLEDSSLEDETKRKNFTSLMLKYADSYPLLKFSFEATLEPTKILEFINLKKNFFITFDTGNIFSADFPTGYYITTLCHKFNNVHLKDKNEFGTVFPTSGLVNFKEIFALLKELNYDGLYTLQTARSLEGLEQETITYHRKLFEVLYDRA